MTAWSTRDLDSLERASEIRVAGRRTDGSLPTPTTVWGVVVDGALYLRSYKGPDGRWYRAARRHDEGAITWGGRTIDVSFVPDASKDAEIDAAYLAKYGNGSATQAMITSPATETTLRVEPR
ncbi:DUF2255 family protein [Agromyces kandeliae]|uniref:DUF2255 family protein n=1 Tax=Agromyces kandeliae TaxID=2666141 RepID=A0A6L5R3F6_9MICO|nr:DUF2255 family protein [Agromyces kandeliae]MRX44581.1 DUF2255 family protein [Agromyces kandeliae]